MNDVSQMLAAKQFVKENIRQLASELIGWKNTGLLTGGGDGMFRQLARMLPDNIDRYACAESMVVKEALVFTSKHE